jgi:hypothetical protein
MPFDASPWSGAISKKERNEHFGMLQIFPILIAEKTSAFGFICFGSEDQKYGCGCGERHSRQVGALKKDTPCQQQK